MSEEDDDFEDLFSFGATTPGAAPNTTKEATSTDSDFDVLMSDVSLSTPESNGADKNNNGGTLPSDVDSSIKTPRSSSDIDEFDALFGTPPVNNNSATPSGDKLTATEKDSLLAIDELPSTNPLNSNFDDFHVHDEETRDMLDWLDDDNTGNKKGTKDDSFSDINSNVSGDVGGDTNTKNTHEDIDLDDDDFDFDKMLADVGIDDSSPPKSTPVVAETKKKEEDDIISTEKSIIFSDTSKIEEPQTQVVPVVEESKATEETTTITTEDPADNITENTTTTKTEEQVVNTDDNSSTPIIEETKPKISAGIEEELAFDKWEDDDEEEEAVEDLQLNVVDSNDGDVDKTEASETQVQNQSTEIKPPPSPKKITFTSLSDAIRSNASTIDDVRSLFSQMGGNIEEEERAKLWTKVICGKTFEDISNGSLADSYREWEKKDEVGTKFDGEEYSAIFDSLLEHGCGMTKEDEGYDIKKQQLTSLSYFHSRNKSSTSPMLDGIDPLIPPVALAILQAGIPTATASVVLSQIEPAAMPLLRLGNSERYLAAKALHSEFYLLACYHLPLLVMHLDRHCPGWHWPRRGKLEDSKQPKDKGDEEKPQDEEANDGQSTESNLNSKKKSDQLEQNGLVPLSWFVTNFAGEAGSNSCLNHSVLLQLWDNVLTNDYSWKYFLAIAVLEKKSDILLMSRGDELKKELEKIVDFQDDAASSESFVGTGDESSSSTDGTASEWLSSGKSLMEATPSSVIDLLRSTDDRAVANALKVRQTKVDKELQAELDAQEAALRKEREEREKAAEAAENKARLIAYYREVQPEKVETVDAILKMFDGRMGVLNEKLKKKYGKGFLPDEDIKDQTRSFLISVNQSISHTRKHVSTAVAERRNKKNTKLPEGRSHASVVLEVSATEVIPVICTTKGQNLANGKKMSPSRRVSDKDSSLQFYLVDCRPESITSEQGRFPTSVALSPEKLQDPEQLQTLTEMFESLRGAVHIVVMGEGFASFPALYNRTLSKAEEQKLLEDDIARISNCALFFLKKGFPFVSVLRGGFAASHAFLSRNSIGMTPPDVLVEYDPDISLFAQLETARQEEEKYKTASTKEKTARSLQKIIDNSMVRLTLSEQRINNSVNNLAKPETVDKMKESVSNFMSKPRTMPTVGLGRAPVFLNKYSLAKKFAVKDGEPDNKKPESIQDEDKDKPATSPADKMNFKLPSLPSSLPSEKDIDNTERTESAPSSEDKAKEPSTDKEKAEAASPSKKMSTAFASFTQRVQQQSNKTISSSPAASDNTTPESEDTPSSSKSLTFSSFANRIKQVKVTDKEPEETDNSSPSSQDKAADADNTASESPSKKVSSAFASLKSAASSALAASEDKQSDAKEGETVKEKSSISSFSSFTNRITLNKSEPPTVSSSEESKDATADPKAAEKSEEESPKDATSDRLNKFKLSMGTSLSGFREKVAESRVSNSAPATNNDDEGKATDTSNTDGSMLSSKFTTSIGSFSSMKNKFTTDQPTFETTKSSEQTGEEGSISTTLSSLGKLLTTDKPRPKTRFQRADEEEAISFDSDEAQTSTVSTADESNDLLLGLDTDLTDVSLTNSGSGEDKEDKPPVEKEKPVETTTESESTQ